MKRPQVSVVMPVFNSEKYVGAAIESVLRQTLRDFEFIIVDDCSTDGSLGIIRMHAKKDRRIVVVQNTQNLGISKSRNAGLARARGKYIMNMDHDDVCTSGRMALQAQYLAKHPDAGIVGSDIDVINEDGAIIGERIFPKGDSAIRRMLMHSSPFTHPSTMVRSSAYDGAGKYDKSFEPADDYELYFRIGRSFRFENLQSHLLKHRIYGEATTMKKTRQMMRQTLRAKWRGATKLGYGADAMAISIALGQLASLALPSFVLGKIALSQYRMKAP